MQIENIEYVLRIPSSSGLDIRSVLRGRRFVDREHGRELLVVLELLVRVVRP
jgi:hypothetical protein